MDHFTKKKFYKVIVMIILLFCAILLITSLIKKYPDIKNKKFLKEYGWDVDWGGRERDKFFLDTYSMGLYTTKSQISASEKFGLNPTEYEGKHLIQYSYCLKQIGYEEPLRAHICIYKNKMVFAYIWHQEQNLHPTAWSIDTPYQQIVSELKKMKQEFEESIKK